MSERIIESQNVDQVKEGGLIDVVPVALLVPEVSTDYRLPYRPGRPFFVLHPSDNGVPCNVGVIAGAPSRPSWEGDIPGVQYFQIPNADLPYINIYDEHYGRTLYYGEVNAQLGGWVAVVEPLGDQWNEFPSMAAEKALVRAIRAFDLSQQEPREIMEGFAVADEEKLRLYPVAELKDGLNPFCRFSIGDNRQINFSPL